MHGSCLTITWLQDEYAPPVSGAAMESIKSIDWAAHAFDFQF
jgi:hypothetical protein